MHGEGQEDAPEPDRQPGSPEVLAMGPDLRPPKLEHQEAQDHEQDPKVADHRACEELQDPEGRPSLHLSTAEEAEEPPLHGGHAAGTGGCPQGAGPSNRWRRRGGGAAEEA